MSLFASKEWWAAKLGSEEEFDQGSMCVANIDQDSSGAGKLKGQTDPGMLPCLPL